MAASADGEGKKLDCPTCGSKTILKQDENVAGLPDNEFVIKLLTAVGPNRSQMGGSVCSYCDKEPSITICMECELLLCHSCCASHYTWPRNRNHVLVSLSEITNRDEHKQSGADNLSSTGHKVEKSLQRTNDVWKNSKLEELLSARKVIDDDIQTLQNERPPNLTTFQVQVENPQSCMEKLCFVTMFENLSKKKNLTEYLNRWAENELGKKLDREELTEYFNQWAKSALGRKLEIALPNMPNTVILKNEEQLCEHLFRFLNNRRTALRLCYRASLDGWSGQQFHAHCDDKAGTVVLVKVGNCIFGGYTDQTWRNESSGSHQWKSSNASFLFSLRNPNKMKPFKCPIVYYGNDRAICCNPSKGATFGGGCDLHISNNSNRNIYSYSNLGNTYQSPPGYRQGVKHNESLFAGSRNFTPTEVEVFY